MIKLTRYSQIPKHAIKFQSIEGAVYLSLSWVKMINRDTRSVWSQMSELAAKIHCSAFNCSVKDKGKYASKEWKDREEAEKQKTQAHACTHMQILNDVKAAHR